MKRCGTSQSLDAVAGNFRLNLRERNIRARAMAESSWSSTTRARRAAGKRSLLETIQTMLHYAIVFLIVALITGVLGFIGIDGITAEIAEVLFFLFLILFVISLIMGRRPPA